MSPANQAKAFQPFNPEIFGDNITKIQDDQEDMFTEDEFKLIKDILD